MHPIRRHKLELLKKNNTDVFVLESLLFDGKIKKVSIILNCSTSDNLGMTISKKSKNYIIIEQQNNKSQNVERKEKVIKKQDLLDITYFMVASGKGCR